MIDQQSLKDRLIGKLKAGHRWTLRTCSMCSEHLSFNSDGINLFYDAGCGCVTYSSNEQRDWNDLDFYLDPGHGHIPAIEAWLAA